MTGRAEEEPEGGLIDKMTAYAICVPLKQRRRRLDRPLHAALGQHNPREG